MAGRHRKPNNCVCEVCAVAFHISPAHLARGMGRFCSRNCWNQWRTLPRIDRVCPECGTTFQTTASHIQRGHGIVCSRECQHRHMLGERETRVCEHCGAEFQFLACPSKIADGKGRFCSKECCYSHAGHPLRERFWKFVGPPEENGCIPWIGGFSANGYGAIRSDSGQQLVAHRVSYELFIGPIPDGLLACHTCDTPKCVNPFHLFLGTPLDNMTDKVTKGRHAWGEGTRASTLTAIQVQEIRERYYRGGTSFEKLAAEYGVAYSTIRRLIIGETWSRLQ
jgi:hypothetical protein